jgi:acyl carrier protein
MSTQDLLGKYILDELAKGRKSKISPQDDLLSEGIIDSLGILQLVSYIEEEFSLAIPDEDVVIENFQSLDALSSYVDAHKA